MKDFNELKKVAKLSMEINEINNNGDIMIIIKNEDGDNKTILLGKVANDFLSMVENYLNEMHKQFTDEKEFK